MTLEDRGLAVPFTTPMLASCRIRRDYRERLEILVPSLADGRGLYVIPWAMLPEVTALTLHDRILHEEISTPAPLSPRRIREASLKVAETGLAGAPARDAAKRTREEDAAEVASFQAMVATQAARAVMRSRSRKPTLAHALPEPAVNDESAALLAPIGFQTATPLGRLRQLASELDDFSLSLDRWIDAEKEEEAKLARFCSDMAQFTRERSSVYLADFDYQCDRMARDVECWPAAVEVLERTADRIAWLLDGWRFPLDWWHTAANEAREEQSLALFGIFRTLPLIPNAEANRPQLQHRVRMGAQTRRWARQFEDWQTGQDDTELVVRIERLRAQV